MFSEIDDGMMVLLARFGVGQAEARRQLAQASLPGVGNPLAQVAGAAPRSITWGAVSRRRVCRSSGS